MSARRAEKPAPAAGPARKLTLLDVARALGVSRTTISNAFNRPDKLSAALRDEVIRKSRELGYFGPDPAARAMRRTGVHEVAVIFHHDLVHSLSDPPSVEFLRGVAHELDSRHISLQLIPRMGRRLDLAAAFQTTADALIVYAEVESELATEVQALRKPVVLVDAHLAGVATVANRDREGAELAMAHALAAQPDRVVVLSFPLDGPTRQRLMAGRVPAARCPSVAGERGAGCLAALKQAGYPAERVTWLEVDGRHPENAAELVQRQRSLFGPGCRAALVAMSDRMALAALPVMRAWRGVNLVAAVGFDDIEAATRAGLTTVRQDAMRKGELAVRALLDGERPDPLPLELVRRQT
jgi:DNA-binding LacI/PurR family transcriptional regulator